MDENKDVVVPQVEASPRQPAIDFFEKEANLPETRQQAASYREIAVGIAGGDQEAINQGYLALEDIHADLCAEVSQAYQEYQAKEQKLAETDDAPYQKARNELQEIRKQKEEAFRDKNWDQAITLDQEEMAKRAEMQQTPTGQLKARIETLNRTMEINSQEMGPISAAAKSLYPTPTV